MQQRRPRRVGNRLLTTGYEGRVDEDAGVCIIFEFARISWYVNCLIAGLIHEVRLRFFPGLSRGNLRWLWLHSSVGWAERSEAQQISLAQLLVFTHSSRWIVYENAGVRITHPSLPSFAKRCGTGSIYMFMLFRTIFHHDLNSDNLCAVDAQEKIHLRGFHHRIR